MRTLRAVVIAGAIGAACAGCSSGVTAPTAPQVSSVAPQLTGVDARVEGSALILDVRTNQALLDVRGQDLQVFLDTDDNPATGYGAHGDEYVARMLESQDAVRFPLRRTEPVDPSDPAGWGALTGIGWVGYGENGVELRIPLSTVGGGNGRMRIRVELYSGGTFDYRDTSTDSAIAATE